MNTAKRPVIVHVLTRLLRAGSEENTLYSCRAQAAAGADVVLVHGREFDPAVAERARGACEVVRLDSLVHPISPAADLRAVGDLVGLLRARGAEVVHTHQSKAGILGRIAARIAHVPAIVHGVHILPFVNVGRTQAAIYVAAEKLCARFTDAFVNVSPSVRDACVERGIGAPEDHFVAYSAMEVDRFKGAEPPADWRTLLGVEDGAAKPPTALMLAAFEPRKRHAEVLRALPAAFAGLGDWRILFAGAGPEEAAIRDLAAQMGLQARVRFAGHRPDPESLIALCDVAFLTSEREGLPRVVVQYAAAGKAMVVSEIPGLADVVEAGRSAVVTPHADVDAAMREVARLLADTPSRERLQQGAGLVRVDQWSPQNMERSVADAYAHARQRRKAGLLRHRRLQAAS